MKEEDLGQILVQMGLDRNEANRILRSLMDQFINKGSTREQAIDIIAADIQSRGKLFHKLQSFRQKKPELQELAPALQSGESCPKCGHPKPVKKGEGSAKECAKCGVIFEKILPTKKEFEPPSAPGKAAQSSSPSALRQFASRHKAITITVSVLLFLFFVGLATKGFYKHQHSRLLTAFDEALKMDTKEEFETSLENLQYFMESTALLVAMRGWSDDEITEFWGDVKASIKRFTEKMETAASGETGIFGYDLQQVKNNLCAGEKIVVLSIRNEESRSMISSFSFMLARCDETQYKTSSKMVLLRDGDQYVLRHRQKGDSSGKPDAKHDDRPEVTSGQQTSEKSVRKTVNGLQEARIFLYSLQEDYRRRYNRWCTDDRELISISKTNGNVVPPNVEDLVENGWIATEIVDDRVTFRYPRGLQ